VGPVGFGAPVVESPVTSATPAAFAELLSGAWTGDGAGPPGVAPPRLTCWRAQSYGYVIRTPFRVTVLVAPWNDPAGRRFPCDFPKTATPAMAPATTTAAVSAETRTVPAWARSTRRKTSGGAWGAVRALSPRWWSR